MSTDVATTPPPTTPSLLVPPTTFNTQFGAFVDVDGSLGQFLHRMMYAHAQNPKVFAHQPYIMPAESGQFRMTNYIANNSKFAHITDTNENVYIFSAFFPFSYCLALDESECVRFEMAPNTRFVQPATASTEALEVPVSYMMMDRYSAAFLEGCKHGLNLVHSDDDSELIQDIYVMLEDDGLVDESERVKRVQYWRDAITAVDASYNEWIQDLSATVVDVRAHFIEMRNNEKAKRAKTEKK